MVAVPSARRCFQPDREVRGQLVLAAHEVRHLQHVGALAGELLGGEVVDAGVEAQVLVDRQVLEQRELLAHVADAALGPLGVGDDVLAQDADAAGLRGDRAGEHADGRGLAAAVRAEEPEDLASGDVEVDAVHGGEVAETLGEAAHGDGDVGGREAGRPRPPPPVAAGTVLALESVTSVPS